MMKKSLIWRSIICLIVIGAWAISIFPVRQKPFMDVFEKLASEKVEEYRAKADDSEEGAKFKRYVEDYERIVKESREKIAEDSSTGPYNAVYEAARGNKINIVPLNRYISVHLESNASNKRVLSFVRKKAAATMKLGMDLAGGTEFILSFDEEKIPSESTSDQVMSQVIEILRNRIDVTGLVEAEIKQVGPTSISLTIPTMSESGKAEIREILNKPAVLTFHLVAEKNASLIAQYKTSTDFSVPPGVKLFWQEIERDNQTIEEPIFLSARPEPLKGNHVSEARVVPDSLGNPSIALRFNSEGADVFREVTAKNQGKRLAIVLDGKCYSAPTINDVIAGGRAEITGSFTQEEARRLAGVIDAGHLQVPINIDSEFGTDPTLGADSIKSGLVACGVGFGLVLLFILYYYRFAGIIAVSALFVNIVLVFGTLAIFGATLTLPGIAGIVLTVGMAIDANVLIFERIREEMQKGRSVPNAVRSGYSRAFITILDSNLTTLVTAFILFRFGAGPIRGFAVTLGIGIAASMFTALFMTRILFDLKIYKGSLEKLSMAHWLGKTSFNFLGIRKAAVVFSALLILGALIGCFLKRDSAMGIDFTGGTAITYQSQDEAISKDTVKTALDNAGIEYGRIGFKTSMVSGGKMLEIILPQSSSGSKDFAEVEQKLEATFAAEFASANMQRVETYSIGDLVGAQFKVKAFKSGFFAALVIILYITFRFELAYGVASVVALIHDVIIAAGIFIILGGQISLPVVAALLTIMGYSLNDTIVVFDRIREDIGTLKKKSYHEIINLSINQTLSRTMLTSLTTLLVVVVLLIFGAGTVKDFATVMVIGVIVGTYSSIFVAGSMIAIWHKAQRNVKEDAANQLS